MCDMVMMSAVMICYMYVVKLVPLELNAMLLAKVLARIQQSLLHRYSSTPVHTGRMNRADEWGQRY